jgi:hypothetical protein
MTYRLSRAFIGTSTLGFCLALAGCGSYDQPSKATAGAGGSGTAQAGTGGVPSGGGGQASTAGQASGGGGQSGGGGAAGSGGQAGSGGSGGAIELPCPSPVPTDTTCGGDVLGTWAATSCPLAVSGVVDMMGLGLGCPTGEITSGSLTVTGTWTADAEGNFTDNSQTKGVQKIELPPACLTVSGFVTTCDRVSDPFGSTLGYASVTCVDNDETGGCSCDATIDQKGGLALVSLASPDAGKYTATGQSLVLTKEKVDTAYNYCVAESTLTLALMTVSKTGSVMAPIVLQKQ